MGQMTAVRETHAQDRVARLQERDIHGHVRLGAGMRLDIDVFGTVEAFGAVNGNALDLVDIVAAPIVAGAGIALGIFVRQMAAHGLHHGLADEILGSDQLDMIALTAQLAHHRSVNFWIAGLDIPVIHGKRPPSAFKIVKVLYLVCRGLTMGRINEYSLLTARKDSIIIV